MFFYSPRSPFLPARGLLRRSRRQLTGQRVRASSTAALRTRRPIVCIIRELNSAGVDLHDAVEEKVMLHCHVESELAGEGAGDCLPRPNGIRDVAGDGRQLALELLVLLPSPLTPTQIVLERCRFRSSSINFLFCFVVSLRLRRTLS